MRGYPLDPAEKAAITRALNEIEQSRTNGARTRSHEQPERPERPRHANPSDTESSSEA